MSSINVKYITPVRVFTVKYLCCTNTKPSRVKITDPRLKESVSVTFMKWTQGMTEDVTQTACNYLTSQGWSCVGRNSFAGVVIVADPLTKSLKKNRSKHGASNS